MSGIGAGGNPWQLRDPLDCAREIDRLKARVKELEAENKRLREEIEWFFGKDSKFPHLCPEEER
jgi:hypothetical protein